jgi:cyclopropane fatty-acyl-phospholipid synthase-like methyltransferase
VAIYDLLARHYDAVTGDSSTETAFIDNIIKHAHGQAVKLLEVACGTGGIITALADRYQVSGLDISPGMLAVARKKLPEGTPLYLADMSCFNLSMKFDAVICVYHGINHLLDFSAWESFFDCAYRHLNDGGVLIFDSYTASNLKMMASVPEIVQQFGENYLHIRVRTNDEVMFDWNIEVLELQQDGRYKSLTEVIRTVAFPSEKIQESLNERFINLVTIESDSGAVNDDSETRTWFVCTKPGDPTLDDAGHREAGRPPSEENDSSRAVEATRTDDR